MEIDTTPERKPKRRPLDPFKRAVLRGLGVLLPPLLTVVIFLWIGNTVANYLLDPAERFVRGYIVEHYEGHVVAATSKPDAEPVEGIYQFDGEPYYRLAGGDYIPASDYEDATERYLDANRLPDDSPRFYREYVDKKWLSRWVVIPVFTVFFLLLLYFLGKFLAAGAGRFFWNQAERLINRVPLVRNVYSSVKQVTDFAFSERELEYTRVVAIEYPRKGIWALAMVTGEGVYDVACAANEPVVSLLVPTSPMPLTGFTVTAKKSEILDLNITIDQAIQFIVSCGVVCPPFPNAPNLQGLPIPPKSS